jgi:hypothetical protein
MATDLTTEATEGYQAPADAKCPYLWSSPSAMAWRAGQWLKATGRSAPRIVRTSRGYGLRVNDMLVRWRDDDSIEQVS